jgi:uncharacterized protein
MLFPDGKLIIFSKAPISGQVKRRLIPVLGADAAAKLHQEMLEQKLRMTLEQRIAPVELYCWPHQHHPYLQDIPSRYSLTLHSQQGSDLGERMAAAIQRSISEQHHVVLIGTDCPPLDRAYLIQAFQALQDGADAVIGPAEDGGYILIGLSRFDRGIFENIEWGTGAVCSQTVTRLKQLDFSYVELNTLWDVDRPEDLERLGKFYD